MSKNIFKEIQDDLGIPVPESGNLTRWANQGVLLLNATLTVRAHQAGSHQKKGWEEFTGESMGDAPYLFDFDSYVVKLQVTYNDGTEREYTHLATALYFEP